MKKIIVAAAIFALCVPAIAFAQTDNSVLNNATSKLTAELSGHVTEKAYLHFDRPYPCYVAGEPVYFKAYVTMGEKHDLSTISSILHADLINQKNLVIQSETIELVNGTGWGDFQLPDTLRKGSYRIRAYTQWMRNDAHPYFFDQFISVSSMNNVDQVEEAVKKPGQPMLQFFPEGGNQVAEIPSKVAFKAVGSDGLGVSLKGVILDNDNKEVAKIASNRFGMGAFAIAPDPGKSYKAKVTFADGSQSTIDLPAVEAKGMTLAVNNDDPSKVSIEIKANHDYYKENLNKEINILIYSAGDVRTIKTKLDNSILGLDLPSKNFRTGILQVTLLSAAGEPLNERLAFVRSNDLLNVSLSTNKTSFAKRENVQLGLIAKNNDGNPVTGAFSVSVIDESKILVDEDAENTILSYLLLKSELKGYVEKPNYYFAHDTKETRADLDALMLTQGYRRFVWKQVLDNKVTTAANTFVPDRTVDISGMLKTKAGAPLANTSIILIEGSGGAVLTQQTDANGHFDFAKMAFYTGVRYILKVQSAKLKNNIVLELDKAENMPVSIADNSVEAKYNANADILASLQNNSAADILTASNDLTNTLLKSNKEKDDNNKSYKPKGAGNATQVLQSKDFLNSPSLSLALNGLLRGVYFTGGSPYLQNSTTASSDGLMNEPMLVVVDGVSAASSDVDLYNPNDVEMVEMLKGPGASVYGIRGGNGVLLITTKQTVNAADDNKETAPGIFTIHPAGFYKAREFYSPFYSAGQTATTLPDGRTTIFWKPDVTTGTDGNASFNFFNADGAGTYRVEVQGIDNKGNLGMQVYRYKVE
jgi:TonB-dependent SusC/RagA subfamily outer membrane receptor